MMESRCVRFIYMGVWEIHLMCPCATVSAIASTLKTVEPHLFHAKTFIEQTKNNKICQTRDCRIANYYRTRTSCMPSPCMAWSYCRQPPHTAQPRVFCQINFVLIIRLIFISWMARRLIRFQIKRIDFYPKIERVSANPTQHFTLINPYYYDDIGVGAVSSPDGRTNCRTVEWENNLIKSGPWKGQPVLNFVTALDSGCAVGQKCY